MQRFTGTIDELGDVSVGDFPDWLRAIPVSDWAKLADSTWNRWGDRLEPLAQSLTAKHYPGCSVSGIGIFVLEPGQMHPAHTDVQPDNWLVRVHVPLVTNPHCTATMDDGFHPMRVGRAYRFNTLVTHAVSNAGKTPRAHFIFDIHGKA